MEKEGYVYILTNTYHRVLYTGVTSDLGKRIGEHKDRVGKGFAKKYNCDKLVYFESCGDIEVAIRREKQIKGGSRERKIGLIESINPDWLDLSHRVGT